MLPRFLVVAFFAGLATLQVATTERGGSETRGAACENARECEGDGDLYI